MSRADTSDAQPPGGEPLSPVKRALLEIRELRARVAELESAPREPIAIVGIGIRTPGGVRNMEDFAGLLWSGTDAITPIPADRWSVEAWYDADQDAPGKMYSREGGFLAEVDRFDAEFFGIAPVEAASMDPQQRLVLELAWEALEDAGHAPPQLAGRRVGVYLGIANGDYGRAIFSHPELIDPYFSSGNAFSVASGRVAYLLGLHGPAVSIDTACSSSLVAVHLACQALRSGECELALAGGVNLILSPEINVNFCKAGMMSRAGRCKTFDAAADGYVRGEGGAIIVLRRLRDAQADGDRVLAVIRGSAINQDGRSNGLTAPNGPAQESVIRAALEAAGVKPAAIDYVEAHGTGTALGDPIEVNALGAVLAGHRASDQPLLLGSVKTNVGHLEAAAGIVGLAKAVLVLQRHETPPHLHLQAPSPYIDWAALPVKVPSGTHALRSSGSPLLAGVSSFGFSGTNAHIVLQEAPVPAAATPASSTRLLAISARDPQALDTLAAGYMDLLERRKPDAAQLADICYTASAGRAQFAMRASCRGGNATELADALAQFRRGERGAGLVAGNTAAAPRVAFLFPGQGPQYLGMGRELHATEPVFRETFDACAAVLHELLPAPLGAVLSGSDAALLDQTVFAQPAMFAIEVSLAALWRSWGIEPVAVMGHSFGEYAAACVAGAMSLEDGARMVAARGRLTQSLPPGGAMAVLEAGQEAVAAAISASGRTDVSIAALNGAANTVVSGAIAAVEALIAQFAARGAKVKRLRVSQAFHSPLVEPVLDAFEREVVALSFAAPRIALVSSLLGRAVEPGELGVASYWRDHLRQPVRFADSIEALSVMGITHFLELSPHPVLLGMGAEMDTQAKWLPSLREGQQCWAVIYDSLQQLWCAGAPVAWQSVQHGAQRHRVALPSYPFRRRRCWIDAIGQPPGGTLPDRWVALAQAMDRQAERGPLDLNAASYPAKWDCLARLTRSHAIEVLRGAGLFIAAGESHTLDEVLARAGIAVTYRHLIGRWLAGLVAQGLLRSEADAFRADAPLPQPELARLWREAATLFVDNQPLLDYVRNCGARVGAVLAGRESALETLFPDGSFDLALGLYERSATMRYINALAGAALEALAVATPATGALRILEIGGGTGGTTSSLLPLLPLQRTRYLFTDVSELFLSQARERFRAFPFMDYALFDLDSPSGSSAVAPGGFDVIVSANCVHAMTDLRAALTRLIGLLAPGGVLVLVESTVHLEYFDMTTGLIEGWQHFADDLRTDNPLLPPSTWIEALSQAGFATARSWPGTESSAAALGQHVIVARAPGVVQAAIPLTHGAAEDAHSAPMPTSGDDERRAWRLRYDAAFADERFELAREMVRAELRRVLQLEADALLAGQARLMDLGMDSLMAVQLRNGLSRAVQSERPLPSTLVFDYPTIDAIAKFLVGRLSTARAPEVPAHQEESHTQPAALDAAVVAAMSDGDIERLLEERLRGST